MRLDKQVSIDNVVSLRTKEEIHDRVLVNVSVLFLTIIPVSELLRKYTLHKHRQTNLICKIRFIRNSFLYVSDLLKICIANL